MILVIITALYITHASKPGGKVEGCGIGCSGEAVRLVGNLRVVSLNMLHGFPLFRDLSERVDLIAREIQRLDADVVLLQEVPWTIRTGNVATLLGDRLGYNYLYYRANGNKKLIFFEQGEAILSRFDLIEPRSTVYRSKASYFDTRVALGATLVTPWGKLDLFVTHLTNKNLEVAGSQAVALQSFVATRTNDVAVVAGDFNSPEDSAQIIGLAQVWIDTYRRIHPDDPGYTCCIDDLQSDAAKPLNERIDYIFLDAQAVDTWKLLSADKVFDHAFASSEGWQWVSDHVGLMVELQTVPAVPH